MRPHLHLLHLRLPKHRPYKIKMFQHGHNLNFNFNNVIRQKQKQGKCLAGHPLKFKWCPKSSLLPCTCQAHALIESTVSANSAIKPHVKNGTVF